MALSAAERTRRYRAHSKGDHTLCDPDRRCDGVTTRFGPGGQQLWDELGGDRATAGRRALLVEACRITDRLDKLDRLLRGSADDWLGIVHDKGDPERQIVVIDRPLAEARQQATALKQIVAELRQSAGKADQPEREADGSDELAKRREERRRAAGL